MSVWTPRSSRKEAAREKAPKYIVIKNEREAREELRKLDTDRDAYGLDTEGANPESPNRQWEPPPSIIGTQYHQIICWSYYDPKRDLNVVVHGNLLPMWARWMADPKIRKIISNRKYDEPLLEKHGVPVRGCLADTTVEDFLFDENRSEHGLKQTALDHCNIYLPSFMDLFGFFPMLKSGKGYAKKKIAADLWDVWVGANPAIKTTREELYAYSARDPWASYRVHKTLMPELKKMGIWGWYRTWEHPFTDVLYRMEPRGIRTDVARLEEVADECFASILRVETLFRALTDRPDFNLKSNKQKAELIFEDYGWPVVKWGNVTKSGNRNPSLDQEALEIYVDDHGFELAEYLQDHTKLSTMHSTFLVGLLRKIYAQGDDYCRTVFKQTRVKTHRLSSGDRNAKPHPLQNMQNLPAQKKKDPWRTRRAFIPDDPDTEGLIVKDYTGMELVGMAEFSDDKELGSAILRRENLHAKTACALFGGKYPKIKLDAEGHVGPDYKGWLDEFKEKHQDWYLGGKITNFSLNYKMSVKTYANRLKIEEEEAARRIEEYFKLYSGIPDYWEWVISHGRQTGYVPGIAGTRGHILGLKSSDRSVRSHAERQAVNWPIQNYNAACIKVAMVELDRAQRGLASKLDLFPATRGGYIQSTMRLQVHDELVFCGPKKALADDDKKITYIMSEAPKRAFGLKYPITVGGGIGPNWNDAKG